MQTTKCTSSEVKEALQYQPNTKSLQDVMYTSGSGGNEEILLEDMLEDTQVIERHRKSRITWCFNRFTKHCRPELIVWDMHAKHKTHKKLGIE